MIMMMMMMKMSRYYDICIRRARSYCSVCYSPAIAGTGTTAATS